MTNKESDTQDELAFIRKLCPDLNEEQLREAEDNFREYADVVLRIYTRIAREKLDRTNNSVPDFDSSESIDNMKDV